ncbi:MAG: RNA polymerase subunit sigma [Deltaproteobacteria bacterium]|nr:MAG: RNA polymerase subunit sigma [Deltaproteobacteria bacterium]
MNNKAFQPVDPLRSTSAPEVDERRLIRQAKRGDERAFRMLMEKYRRRVYAVAYGMVRDREEALDISQEVFIKVYRYLGTFQGSSSFYTWLYRVTVNLSIDHIRRRARRDNLEFDDAIRRREPDDQEALVAPTFLDSNPLQAAGRKELSEQIQQALDTLSEAHRAVLVLREIEGLSYSEIARTLKIHKGTVMSRLHHARRNLQAALREYLRERGDQETLLRKKTTSPGRNQAGAARARE